MEVTSLQQPAVPARPAPGPLLRLASDERLIALIRRGHHAAFEALVQRYQSRLLAFCRHMLSSREDAEDVLQDVFAAAFNAILADEREINVRPWLYRIARNRSLNHLRRATAIGVDSMDTYFADHGQSVPERILQRESFRALVDDIGHLAETQRTALLLREMDALSYEQIADVMETTVPSVKSLLVRARVALAEAAEARKLSCEEVRVELAEVAEGLVRISPPARRHMRDCARCRSFNKQLKQNERTLTALAPVGGLAALVHKLIATKLGSTTGGAAAASSGGATAGTGAGIAAGAGAASSLGGIGGLAGVGSGAIAAKAVAGLAAAALLTAGAVAVGPGHTHVSGAHRDTASDSGQTFSASAPAVISSAPQALTISHVREDASISRHAHKGAADGHKHATKTSASITSNATKTTGAAAGVGAADAAHLSKARDSSTATTTQAVEVTTSTTALPTQAAPPSAPIVTSPEQPPATTTTAPEETGPTGPTGPTGGTAQEGPAAEAEAPAASGPADGDSGGAQAPPSAIEPAPAS